MKVKNRFFSSSVYGHHLITSTPPTPRASAGLQCSPFKETSFSTIKALKGRIDTWLIKQSNFFSHSIAISAFRALASPNKCIPTSALDGNQLAVNVIIVRDPGSSPG